MFSTKQRTAAELSKRVSSILDNFRTALTQMDEVAKQARAEQSLRVKEIRALEEEAEALLLLEVQAEQTAKNFELLLSGKLVGVEEADKASDIQESTDEVSDPE
jgi:hypothetical protein